MNHLASSASTEPGPDASRAGAEAAARFQLESVAFFGRTLAEYEAFLNIRTSRLVGKRILDVAAGAASFVAEARAQGIDAVGIDPMYGRSPEALAALARSDHDAVFRELDRKRHLFEFTYFTDIEAVKEARRRALDRFLLDFPAGLAQGRYQAASLPQLPFADASFDLVTMGHFLFLYGDRLDYRFHLEACRELCRVIQPEGEVRLYPLCGLDARPYPHLQRLRIDLQRHGITSSLEDTAYAFLKGTNQVLILRKG
jgi:hypothetical protein